MQDSLALLSSLRRSPLLVRTARIGLADYKRNRDLSRLLGVPRPPGPQQAIIRLLDEEARLEEIRRSDEGRYYLGRHIEVLIALMGEATLVQARQPRTTRPA